MQNADARRFIADCEAEMRAGLQKEKSKKSTAKLLNQMLLHHLFKIHNKISKCKINIK